MYCAGLFRVSVALSPSRLIKSSERGVLGVFMLKLEGPMIVIIGRNLSWPYRPLLVFAPAEWRMEQRIGT